MSYLLAAVAIYAIFATVFYIRYETRSHIGTGRSSPRRILRYALPWYYNASDPRGTWIFGFWDTRKRRGYSYKEIGIRILGFEYWVEYWR